MDNLLTDVADVAVSVNLFIFNMCTGNYLVYANHANLALGVLSISVWRSMICALHWMIIPKDPTDELYVPLMLPIEAMPLFRILFIHKYPVLTTSVSIDLIPLLALMSLEFVSTYLTTNGICQCHWGKLNLSMVVAPTFFTRSFNVMYYLNIIGIFHVMYALLSFMSTMYLLMEADTLNLYKHTAKLARLQREIVPYVKTDRDMARKILDEIDSVSMSISKSDTTIHVFMVLYTLSSLFSVLPKFHFSYSDGESSTCMPIYVKDNRVNTKTFHKRLRDGFRPLFKLAVVCNTAGYVTCGVIIAAFYVVTRNSVIALSSIYVLWMLSTLQTMHIGDFFTYIDQLYTKHPDKNSMTAVHATMPSDNIFSGIKPDDRVVIENVIAVMKSLNRDLSFSDFEVRSTQNGFVLIAKTSSHVMVGIDDLHTALARRGIPLREVLHPLDVA
ncbi:hypothetical protein GUITHDRAFT_120540 [Guillardia theta CCMP2712]|uniref:Uncharacterized protein n=1 Tax=Guillardia theta (strain CCMP2712) TaxID=905079 RepID=L1IAL0_GUITC|nr:hypothetical protein GUITHDRAFT_120540 [Guillardia theta CCMP2712]EKX33276.1 hypothetical protein GUITHDRAFT_120540 [Guillardia theta CCMP2712]|eukprot:XP_005820256.1 hypothetical protein GUITHDRAFT_120540 [Guillardia theta CCMP2712]